MEPNLSASFTPDHKSSMILFLQRVYGVSDSQLFIRIMEYGLLPDMNAAAYLDTVIENEVSIKVVRERLFNASMTVVLCY